MSKQVTPATYTCDVCGTAGLERVYLTTVSIRYSKGFGRGEYSDRWAEKSFDVCETCFGGSEAMSAMRHTGSADHPAVKPPPARRILDWLFPTTTEKGAEDE